jgi:hypothetical protein
LVKYWTFTLSILKCTKTKTKTLKQKKPQKQHLESIKEFRIVYDLVVSKLVAGLKLEYGAFLEETIFELFDIQDNTGNWGSQMRKHCGSRQGAAGAPGHRLR